MATRRILIIQGHPDQDGRHLCHALAERYAEGARAAGHDVREVAVSGLEFPLLRSKSEWEKGSVPTELAEAQQHITWADHLLLVFPLWLGDMPALVKGFLEQVLRPGFAVPRPGEGGMLKKLLGGRSARIVVTMGMPAFVYRWYFGAHAIRSLERNILRFVGLAPVRRSLVGLVEGKDARRRTRWLDDMERLGGRGA